jgi:hypothetical protein
LGTLLGILWITAITWVFLLVPEWDDEKTSIPINFPQFSAKLQLLFCTQEVFNCTSQAILPLAVLQQFGHEMPTVNSTKSLFHYVSRPVAF